MNKLPNLPIQIVGRDNVSNLYDLLGSRPLVLALHRFFGCTLSQYELGNLIREYRSLENPGFDLVVGVQSYPAYIRSLQDRFDGVPVICDVEGELYKALGLGSAADREELGRNPIVAETVAKAKEAGLVHGEDSGNPLQYPGLFVIAPDGEIRYAFRADAPAGLPSLADAAQRSRPALTVLHTTKRERNQMVSLPFFAIHWIGA